MPIYIFLTANSEYRAVYLKEYMDPFMGSENKKA